MLTFKDCTRVVSDFRQVEESDIYSHLRTQRIAHARQEAIYLARKHSKMSTPQIGFRINRDHTTILHAIKAVKARCKAPAYRAEIEAMTTALVPTFYRHASLFFKSRRPTQ